MKQLEVQLADAQFKVDEMNRTLNDLDGGKKKLAVENSELQRQLEESESQVAQLNKIKASLATQLEEAKRMADEEARVSRRKIRTFLFTGVLLPAFEGWTDYWLTVLLDTGFPQNDTRNSPEFSACCSSLSQTRVTI